MRLAAVFHDYIYATAPKPPGSKSNEVLSAEVFMQFVDDARLVRDA